MMMMMLMTRRGVDCALARFVVCVLCLICSTHSGACVHMELGCAHTFDRKICDVFAYNVSGLIVALHIQEKSVCNYSDAEKNAWNRTFLILIRIIFNLECSSQKPTI